MAKFNITVELDWLDEDGNIDNTVKEAIIRHIVAKFSNNVSDEINQEVESRISARVNECIDKKLNEILDKFLTNKFDQTDTWGDVVKRKTSVIEILKERLDKFLDEKVDKNGNSSRYDGRPRLDWVIQTNIEYPMTRKIDEAAKAIKTGLEKYIETTIKAQIGENVAQAIGLDKMIKASK